MTPQQLAEACAATLWAPDRCSQWLGIYDIRICNAAGEIAALFRGRAAQRPGTILGGA